MSIWLQRVVNSGAWLEAIHVRMQLSSYSEMHLHSEGCVHFHPSLSPRPSFHAWVWLPETSPIRPLLGVVHVHVLISCEHHICSHGSSKTRDEHLHYWSNTSRKAAHMTIQVEKIYTEVVLTITTACTMYCT